MSSTEQDRVLQAFGATKHADTLAIEGAPIKLRLQVEQEALRLYRELEDSGSVATFSQGAIEDHERRIQALRREDEKDVWHEIQQVDGRTRSRLEGDHILPDTDIMGPDHNGAWVVIITLSGRGGRQELLTGAGLSLDEAKQVAVQLIVSYAAELSQAAEELAQGHARPWHRG